MTTSIFLLTVFAVAAYAVVATISYREAVETLYGTRMKFRVRLPITLAIAALWPIAFVSGLAIMAYQRAKKKKWLKG